MKLSRFLIAGVLLPVMLGANDSKAEVCSGRFYVGVNVGAEFGKMRYSQKPRDQYDVVPDGIKRRTDTLTMGAGEAGAIVDQINDACYPLPILQTNLQSTMSPRRKCGFTGDLEVGYIFEVKNFGIGLALGFSKRFGTIKGSIPTRMLCYSTANGINAREYKYEIPGTGEEVNTPITEREKAYINHKIAEVSRYEKALKYNTKDVTEIKLKNKYNVTITPILEYKANSMFGVYVTGGIRISSDKVTYNETDGATKKVTKFQKTKTSVAPVVGGGILVNLSEHMYAKVQYLYQFGSKIKKTISRKLNDKKNEVTPTVKYRSQKVTVGFGYMF